MADANLPAFNQLVVAFLEGAQEHSGLLWHRDGFAFMVRHDDPPHTVADGWSRGWYDEALKRIGADYAEVKSWAYLSGIREIMVPVR